MIRTARSSRNVGRWLWRPYLVIGACSVAGDVLLPRGLQIWVLALLGFSSILAVFLGTWLHRPTPNWPWMTIGLGIALAHIGGVICSVAEAGSGGTAPAPPVTDVLNILAGLVATAGLVGLVRTHTNRRDLGDLLDALILTTAVGALVWVAFLHAYIARWGTTTATIAAIVGPSVDLVWLVLAIRLLLASSRRSAFLWFGAAGIVMMLANDLVYSFQLLTETYRAGGPVGLNGFGTIGGWVLVGVAALHPSMAVIAARPAAAPLEMRVSTRRVIALGAATLLLPILLWTGGMAITDHNLATERIHLAGLTIATGVMAALVMLRVAGLVRGLNDAILLRHRLERQLRHAVDHDSLVGLWNRRVFHDRVEELLASGDSTVAALFIDIDDFKSVNDALGHAAGDEVLAELARRIDGAVRPTDLAARLGGDEFGVVLPGCATPDVAGAIAARLLAALRRPVRIGYRTRRISASVGIALARDAGDAATLLRNADIAMYLAKQRGKDRIEFFEEGAHVEIMRRLQLRDDLGRALEAGQFVLLYQPIVELDSGRIVGVEALIRWDHPERGRLPPAEFIATLEELGLIVPVGRWVLHEACRQLACWQREQSALDLFMSVNLSPLQICAPRLLRDVTRAIGDAGIAPTDLVLEITEAVLLDVERSVPVLERVRALGVRIALDDFGTGYASMSNLTRVPLDIMKVDRSFVTPLQKGSREEALAEKLLQIAATMGLEAIAEGIESPSQRQALMDLGCRFGQGFLMYVPTDAGAIAELLEQRRTPVAVSSASRSES